jgi:hypothetical protein
MPDQADREGTESQERLESAIRELRASVTEEVLNLRARLLAVEQELGAMRRDQEIGKAPSPRPKKRTKGGPKRAEGPKRKARKREGPKRKPAPPTAS